MNKRTESDGFTIVELMIATSVLSVLLLLVSVSMIGIGKLYFKGVNQARLQNTVRSVSSELAQHLQLNDSDSKPQNPTGTPAIQIDSREYYPAALCIRNMRYTYVIGVQIGSHSNQVRHVLWRDRLPDNTPCAPVDLTTEFPTGSSADGTELIPPNTRLTDFTVDVESTPFKLSIGMTYGDDDLLDNNFMCLGGVGQEFCATALLKTSVAQRIE